jgi:hypothetical protein
MNLVYTTSTDDFQPISFGDSYLYDNYGRLVSFLKSKLNTVELNRLSKPILNSSRNIEWHSVYNGPMKPLDTFSKEHQILVESQYLELSKKINKTISEFKLGQDKDKEEWAKILSLVFKTSDNKLLSNGQDWVFIWGWQFRNKLIIESPDFNIPNEPVEQIIPTTLVDDHIVNNIIDDGITDDPFVVSEIVQEPLPEINDIVELKREKVKISFWYRIKRFFRWVAYRFWGLMLLIIFILLLLCLCKKCCGTNNSIDNENIDKELKRIENRIQERCPASNATL